jgi:hypothetical protein
MTDYYKNAAKKSSNSAKTAAKKRATSGKYFVRG